MHCSLWTSASHCQLWDCSGERLTPQGMNYVQPSWDSPNHLQRDCSLRLSLKPEERRFPLLLPLPRTIHSDALEGCCGRKFRPELKDKPLPAHLPTALLIQLPQVHTQCHCPKHTCIPSVIAQNTPPPCVLSSAFLAHMHTPSCTPATPPHPCGHYACTPFFLRTFLQRAHLRSALTCALCSLLAALGEKTTTTGWDSKATFRPFPLSSNCSLQSSSRVGGCKTRLGGAGATRHGLCHWRTPLIPLRSSQVCGINQ